MKIKLLTLAVFSAYCSANRHKAEETNRANAVDAEYEIVDDEKK